MFTLTKRWEDYRSASGLIRQKQGDEGDSLNRSASKLVLEHLCGVDVVEEAYRLHWTLSNQTCTKFRRSDEFGKWYSNFDRTSRDQLIPMVILLAVTGYREYLWCVFCDHLKRGLLFAYNTRRNFMYPTLEEHLEKATPDVKWDYRWKVPDVTGPDFWALYIRGFSVRFLWPLLWLLDVETLINAVIIRLSPKRDDVINHALTLELARISLDTPTMELARSFTPPQLIQARLDSFFGKDIEPPINELYRILYTRRKFIRIRTLN